ncbi:MAG: VTT domain-containing protein [Acidobacteria bacterium]|jgi:membrane protein DedA with SNARE-associated domain|nr:VTT domain-containing protein [Acidobacteriota bacterium]
MALSYLNGLTGQFILYAIFPLTVWAGDNTILLTDAAESNFFYNLMGKYGLYAVFLGTMWEGDITLLLAGVLAHHGVFGDYGFAQVLGAGTLGGVMGDGLAYGGGRGFERSVRNFRFYKLAAPRIVKLVDKFGTLSIFIVKYIYGLRIASCVFYGVGRMPLMRFTLLTIASVGAWVLVLSGVGYSFSGTIMRVIGDVQNITIYLLIILVVGVAGFYLVERFWLSKKVEEADPERLKGLEHAAQEKIQGIKEDVQDFKDEMQERMHLPRRKDSSAKHEQPAPKNNESGGD